MILFSFLFPSISCFATTTCVIISNSKISDWFWRLSHVAFCVFVLFLPSYLIFICTLWSFFTEGTVLWSKLNISILFLIWLHLAKHQWSHTSTQSSQRRVFKCSYECSHVSGHIGCIGPVTNTDRSADSRVKHLPKNLTDQQKLFFYHPTKHQFIYTYLYSL